MEELTEKTKDLIDHTEDLADTFYRLTVLNVTQKASNIASGAIVMIVMCGLGLFCLFFGGFALAWWLGDLVNSRIGGFLLTATFFLLLLGVIAILRKKTLFPIIRDIIVRKVYD